ncbi:hypothetical protein HanXRQr2_Chr05g0208671 [Helianthus annuus]|uniref:Uncharacterized protein n=1 Tax=Helianthus annuus TaxID=4232 RepID=A0A9K3IYK6_HELAN|nr:hypothetical protein HanXRQr2_Chr05g0208671 [Helianthus annuus]KAJ0922261.1 hypothetical protein HanPSC8_Chr05g0201661 [Helianthus annuus]
MSGHKLRSPLDDELNGIAIEITSSFPTQASITNFERRHHCDQRKLLLKHGERVKLLRHKRRPEEFRKIAMVTSYFGEINRNGLEIRS